MNRRAALLILVGLAAVGWVLWWLVSAVTQSGTLTLYGNVDIREVDLGFRVFGRIEELAVDEGDRVSAGELVARLDPVPYQQMLAQSEAEVNERKVALKIAQNNFTRADRLVSTGAISVEDHDNLRAAQDEAAANLALAKARLEEAKTRLADTRLIAPSDGVVLTRARETGSVVQPGQTIYVVSLDKPIWVRAYIGEADLGRIKPGMKAEVTTDAHPNQPYTGQIGYISPQAEFTPKNVETPDLRTALVYRIRVVIDRGDEYLRRGMPVTVRIPL